jgi:hypothetical protein
MGREEVRREIEQESEKEAGRERREGVPREG